MAHKEYPVIIIGAGVSGAAQVFLLSKYTNIDSMLLIEKEKVPGAINSRHNNNSQTLHEGDIETNYKLEKAKQVKKAAGYTRTYVEKKNKKDLSLVGSKMVLGVGDKEVTFIEERYKSFKKLFPKMQLLREKELKKVEPILFIGRDPKEKLAALYSEGGLTINYQKLAKELIKDAKAEKKKVDTLFGTKVANVSRDKTGMYIVKTSKETFKAKVVVFATGAHSLLHAKKLGYAKDYALLSVAGNFYHSPKYLNTKIYTIQNDKLPFAAVHGDPDIMHPDKTRYGPTTNIVLMLERRKYNSTWEYFKSMKYNFRTLRSFVKIMADKDFFWYALKHNITFRLPIYGNREFVREIRKIIPSMKYKDLKLAKGHGGVRPQIVDTKNKVKPLQLGEARIEGDNVLFNVTPSPGASVCIANAYKDTPKILEFLGKKYKFKKKEFEEDFN